jgi:hypothetical protein
VTGAISEGNIIQILAPFFNYSDMEKGYKDFRQDSATIHTVNISMATLH